MHTVVKALVRYSSEGVLLHDWHSGNIAFKDGANASMTEVNALGRHSDICSDRKNHSKLKTMIWRHSNASLTFDLIF